jgi:molecular chaperone GrpE
MTEKMDDAIKAALASVEKIEAEGDAPAAAEEPIVVEEAPAAPKKSGQDAMLEAMITAKNEAQEVLKQTQKEAKDLFDRLARVSADFDNFRKRQTKEKQDAIKFGNESLVKDLIPVLDNFERAFKAAEGQNDTLVEGIKMVHKQLEDVLARFGVVAFSTVGQAFDPAKAEAVGGRDDPSVPSQTVLEEFQRGYMLHDRLIRPALVIVATGGGGGAAAKEPDEKAE